LQGEEKTYIARRKDLSMTRKLLFVLLGGATTLGCAAKKDDGSVDEQTGGAVDDGENEDETGPIETSGIVPDDTGTSTMPLPDDTGSGSDAADEAGFINEPDGGGVANECDVWENDCPEGQKCMPWANDGGSSWNATKCTPLSANPAQVGDDCMVEGSGVSGIDNCDSRAMCYYVDNETNTGTCIGFCEGTPASPTCDPGFICTIVNEGVLTLCRPACDPLLQNCNEDQACLQATGADGFTCIIDASGESGAAGDPCEFINACDPGLFCAAAEGVPNCAGAEGCCSEFCDLTEAEPVSACSLGGGQDCVPWFEEGSAPPDYEHVGVCAIPA
jgi:hypothetical protein